MPIEPGTRFGPYEVLSLLGAGGMGEVYRARDSRLNRDVALKILPDAVARDDASRARFEREAQAVAALSHPNILAIFDTGAQDGHLFVVTELLEGETLRERLAHGRIPVAKAVEYAAAVARGLAATHDKQVVHRDLKPDNIFLTSDGRIKILDFGLAKSAATIAPGTAVETARAVTGEGVVLGTVGYMAPEQVRGLNVDARADVFSLGAVLYEMLSGKRAFHRDTAADTMSAILREEPAPFSDTGVTLPPGLDRIVRHCLEKNPKERFQSAQDVAFALETLSVASQPSMASGSTPSPIRKPIRTSLIAGIGLAIAAIAFVAWQIAKPPSGPSETGSIAVGTSTQITAEDGLEIDAALSPDGKLLAYSAGHARQMRIYIRPVAGGRTLTLSESATAFEYQPRWSPDGSQILFLRPEGVFVASSLGGAATSVATGAFASAAWAPDGTRVLLARTDRLSVVSLQGGKETEIATKGVDLHSCVWSATNTWIACATGNSQSILPGRGFANVAPSGIVMALATGGPLISVAERSGVNLCPAWSPDGRQLYFVSNREGPRDIFVVDVAPTGPEGHARRVTTGLNVLSLAFDANFNRLTYVTSTMRANLWSMPIPATGPVDITGAQPLTSSNQVVESVTLSSDRKWILFDSTLHLNAEILRMPIDGGKVDRLTNDPAQDFAPSLSPDGKTLAYQSWRNGTRDIFVQPLDGSAPAQALTDTPGQESYPRWSADGQAISFVDQVEFRREAVHGVLFVMRRQPDGQWGAPIATFNGATTQGVWIRTPAGDRLAYASMGAVVLIDPATRKFRAIYVPGSTTDPIAWSVVASDDERTLFFKAADKDGLSTIWSLPVEGGKPRLLVRFSDPNRQSIRPDFAAGAGRFFFTVEDRQADIWVATVSKQ